MADGWIDQADPRVKNEPAQDRAWWTVFHDPVLNSLMLALKALERRLAELGSQLENPPVDPGKVSKLGKEYARVQKEMDEKMSEWERIQS